MGFKDTLFGSIALLGTAATLYGMTAKAHQNKPALAVWESTPVKAFRTGGIKDGAITTAKLVWNGSKDLESRTTTPLPPGFERIPEPATKTVTATPYNGPLSIEQRVALEDYALHILSNTDEPVNAELRKLIDERLQRSLYENRVIRATTDTAVPYGGSTPTPATGSSLPVGSTTPATATPTGTVTPPSIGPGAERTAPTGPTSPAEYLWQAEVIAHAGKFTIRDQLTNNFLTNTAGNILYVTEKTKADELYTNLNRLAKVAKSLDPTFTPDLAIANKFLGNFNTDPTFDNVLTREELDSLDEAIRYFEKNPTSLQRYLAR